MVAGAAASAASSTPRRVVQSGLDITPKRECFGPILEIPEVLLRRIEALILLKY